MIEIIDQLREHYRQSELLSAFGVARSSVAYRRSRSINPERQCLKAKVIQMHQASRGAAGSRTIAGQLQQDGEAVGRYLAGALMKECAIASTQTKKHRYRHQPEESIIAPNHLNRDFQPEQENQIWCCDVTYIWAGTQWLYLAVVLDLFKRRVVGWHCSTHPDLTVKALQMAFES